MFESSSQHVDIYCERLSADFWGEPLNAVTNLAFILAAVFAYMLYRRAYIKARDILALISMAATVGIGSFIFHTIATQDAALADIIPIIIFIHFSVFVIFTRVFALRWWHGIIGVIAFCAFNNLILYIFGRTLLNGSIQYIPTLILLFAVTTYCSIKKFTPTSEFLTATITFTIAITCRSIDDKICTSLPIGTHFLWHILNGVTMYYVMKGIIRSAKNN